MHDVAVALQPDQVKADPFEQTPGAHVAVNGPRRDAVQPLRLECIPKDLAAGENRHVPAGGAPAVAQYPERAGAECKRQIADGSQSACGIVACGTERPKAVPFALHHELHGEHGNPAEQWLVDTAIFLAALLSGAVQQSVNFALAYSVTRQSFRKPIIAHQLVAARLADMIVSAHTTHLFLRSAAAQDTQAQIAPVRRMARHVATEAMDVARELVQLCGGHGYVEGLAPTARFQTLHWFAMLLMKVEAALHAFTASA
jgi:hypothetical protein